MLIRVFPTGDVTKGKNKLPKGVTAKINKVNIMVVIIKTAFGRDTVLVLFISIFLFLIFEILLSEYKSFLKYLIH